MPFLVDTNRAAQIICSGIARGRDEIAFPIPFSWMIKALRIVPYPLYRMIMEKAWKR